MTSIQPETEEHPFVTITPDLQLVQTVFEVHDPQLYIFCEQETHFTVEVY